MFNDGKPVPRKRVMVGSIGDCVHSLGVETFAEWMEDKGIGYIAVKLGPAVPIHEVINKLREARPAVVGISTRLGTCMWTNWSANLWKEHISMGLIPVQAAFAIVSAGCGQPPTWFVP